MIYDNNFLNKLAEQKIKITYVKITALDLKEEPIDELTGRITSGGNINIDGNSAIRRTCSLKMLLDDKKYISGIWGLKTKFSLEVGIENLVNSNYPSIIWFKKGIYIITGFNSQITTKGVSISLSGKDKMCLLNGEFGGNLTVGGNLAEEEDLEGNVSKVPIHIMIRELVHIYGNEPYQNILISDLNTKGMELLEYRDKASMFLYRDITSNIYTNVTFDGNTECFILKNGKYERKTLNDLDINHLDLLLNISTGTFRPEPVYFSDVVDNEKRTPYYVARIDYGQAAGYRMTDMTYPGDLIVKPGETVASILDKIKKMLGAFEYFYDVDGFFHFQKKNIFIKTKWTVKDVQDNSVILPELKINDIYNFNSGELISQMTDTPQINNIKNDYTVWGNRKTISGGQRPVQFRYAIEKKPQRYKNYDGKVYSIEDYDWREILYQMAIDYRAKKMKDNFFITLAQNNPEYPDGKTGYEMFYTDISQQWREIYNPYPASEEEKEKFFSADDGQYRYWIKDIISAPENLNFWFDFLDSNSPINQFAVSTIGQRTKVVNDNAVKGIYFRETPSVIFLASDEEIPDLEGNYKFIQIGNIDEKFSISSQGKSAKTAIDDLVFANGYLMDSISLTTLPIYHLDVNNLIYLNELQTKLSGAYIINKISVSLAYNGTMSISAIRSEEEKEYELY